MRVLVTGCAGFIGSTLVEDLLNKGDYVLGIDDFNSFYDPSIKINNIQKTLKNSNFEIIREDILNINSDLLSNFNIDCIVHLAAYPGVRPSFDNPELYSKNNVGGTLHVLQLMCKLKINKGVFASSSSVYGNNPAVPFSEDLRVEPVSIYGATKLTLESYCRAYANAYRLNITCLRFFTCYGPRQRPDLAIHKFARLIKEGKQIPMFGDGSMSRDFTYIDDIVQGVYLAMHNLFGFNIINLGNAQSISLSTMIATLSKKMGKIPDIKQLETPAGDVRQTWADISKAKKVLGWQPKTSFNDGLDKFLDWMNK